MLTVAAEDGDSAIKLRDKFRRQVADATAARTSVTLGYLFDEWLAGDQVEETPRTSYRVAIEKSRPCHEPRIAKPPGSDDFVVS